MKYPFTAGNFFIRWVLCLFIVFATYNPSRFSYWHWLVETEGLLPYKMFTSFVVVIAYSVVFMVSRKAFDLLGLLLVVGLAISAVWIVFDLGLFSPYTEGVVVVICQVALATVMAIGLSYSHLRSQLSGQVTASS